MSDLISRADAITAFTIDGTRMERLGVYMITVAEAKQKAVDLLEELTSADAAEVIRCKDCKHRRENCGMGDHRWCDFHRMTTRADDFCSYGRRANDGSCK